MSLELLIIRHAKAEPHSSSGQDFDRALSDKGQRQAEGLNAWLYQRLQQENLADWRLRYSPAMRTHQTAELVLRELNGMDVNADERIWNASVMDLSDVLRDTADQASKIILVGHNPGLEQLVMQLTSQLRPVATGSVTEIALDKDFRDGRLVTQFRPEVDSR